MEVPHLPTAEGKRRYPQSNGYLVVGSRRPEDAIPCTCRVDCLRGCDGRCGCLACDLCFIIYAGEQGWLSSDGLTIDREDALVIYGECWPPLHPASS
jgi:hypothetical protein